MPTALLGAQPASLYGWRTIRGLRQQQNCGFLCGDGPAFTQGFDKGLLARCFFRKPPHSSLTLRVFRKPTSPPLNLKSQSSLTLKGGSTSHLGLLPSGKKRKPLLLNSLYDPFGSPCRGQKRRSEPFHSMVGGPSEVYASSRAAVFCAGMNPPCGRAAYGNAGRRIDA